MRALLAPSEDAPKLTLALRKLGGGGGAVPTTPGASRHEATTIRGAIRAS